jgi:1-acyl-sn-glycerol-3-phosphate acyltransferase
MEIRKRCIILGAVAKRRKNGSKLGRLAKLLEPLLTAIDDAVSGATDRNPFQRDPKVVARVRRLLWMFEAFYDPEVRGFDRLPEKGPFLVIANHSGGAESVDPWAFFARWVDERGPEAPFYSLTYNLNFGVPALGKLLRALGFVPASHENGAAALRRGEPVLVFPGGDEEVFRPWCQRNEIDLGGRMGFISLAIRERVPVVPMTIHGTHESTFVLTRGRTLAKATGLHRLRIKVFPLIWNIPFGVTPAYVPSLQLPAKVTVEIGEPLDWQRFGAEHADDPDVLHACYDEITETMQRMLDRLVAEHPYPVLTRLCDLAKKGTGPFSRFFST